MQYLVTDPCYLLSLAPNKAAGAALWAECCALLAEYDRRGNYTACPDVAQRLSDALGIDVLHVSGTGFGDWSNCMQTCDALLDVLAAEFGADAGLMCVVVVHARLKAFMRDRKFLSYRLGAVFETDEAISVAVDASDRTWYVLKILAADGRVLARSLYRGCRCDV